MSSFPRKPMTKLPDGFEYSEEALEAIQERSRRAGRILRRVARRRPELRKIIDQVMSET